MDFLSGIYAKTLAENKKNLHFWKDYLQTLKLLDFNVYADKLKVPALVPIGNRIFFRGELKHTNEVTVALGADYFVKCSLKQAEVLRQHRITGAESKVYTLNKEKEYLENQISFNQPNLFGETGKEIIEIMSDEEDRMWRDRHRQNVKEYKQSAKEREEIDVDTTDEELWMRLEELELQEEMRSELEHINYIDSNKLSDSLIIKDEEIITNKNVESINTEVIESPHWQSKLDLLQQVLDKQNKLEQKLYDLQNKDQNQSKTENDLIAKLDKMEELDDLEDEMDRLDDIIENENAEQVDVSESINFQPAIIKRSVSFANENDSKTLQLYFKHSDVEPSTELYNPAKGISKPSDIYEAHSSMFTIETTSILKKKKYDDFSIPDSKCIKQEKTKIQKFESNEDTKRTIVINDIIEKDNEFGNKMCENQKRPKSIFKKMRQQNKI